MAISVARPHGGSAHGYSLAAFAARTMRLARAVFTYEPDEPDPLRHRAVRRDAYMESAAMRREMHRL